MCRSYASGETPRRCPCTSSNRRSAYERGSRAAKKAAAALEAEELGLEVTEESDENLSYLEEVALLQDKITAIYVDPQQKRRRRQNEKEDADKLDSIENIDPELDERVNAVVRLGHLVASRAEEISGVNAEMVKAAIPEKDSEKSRIDVLKGRITSFERQVEVLMKRLAKFDVNSQVAEAVKQNITKMSERIEAARQEIIELERDILISEAPGGYASDLLHKLSDGYLQALSEIREVGGEMKFNNEKNTLAVKLFTSAAKIFPSDWIDYSNEARGGVPFARAIAQRAHYSHFSVKSKNVRVPKSYIVENPAMPPQDTEWTTVEKLSPEETAEMGLSGSEVYRVFDCDNDRYYFGLRGEDGMPIKGTGWEKYEERDESGNTTLSVWKRKVYRTERISEQSTSEITAMVTDKESDNLSKNGYADAVHELSHRFEYVVPEISAMEADYLEYRTTDENGERNPQFTLYKRTSEVARMGGFISKYMGKEYSGTAFELLSTGIEGLFGHAYGALIGYSSRGEKFPVQSDEHMRAFVLGVLASAGKRYLKD